MDLTALSVVITGAGGNLGRVVAESALAKGAHVVLIDRQHDAELSAVTLGRVIYHETDLLDREETAKVFRSIERIDVLCNIAGGFTMGTAVHQTGDEIWARMFDINVRTLLNAVRAAVPRMVEQGRGSIVNVGAVGGVKGQANMAAYSVAKSAVARVTESMSAELKRKGVNVNCVLPGTLDTPQNRADMPTADPALWVKPADLAEVILFLASPRAAAIHGAALPVTGRA